MKIIPSENTQVLTKLYVFISRDEQGMEGICATFIGNQHCPLITGEARLLSQMRTLAKEMLKNAPSGTTIHLVEFYRGDVEEQICS